MKGDFSIKKISIYKINIPLRKPFVISLGPVFNAENIIVTIETKNGLTGTGECSPFMTINGESQETCFIVGQYLAKMLKGKNAVDIDANHQVMDRVIYGNTSIKSAFDMAMHDIAAQKAKVPLYKLLGGKKKKVVTDFTVSIDTPELMAETALELKKYGFKIIKVKLAGDPNKDIERVKFIRKAVGSKIAIRIDANQGWSLENAITALRGMKGLDIQYCEEPIPRWDWQNLKILRKKSPVKIMADESCEDEHDAARLIAIKACDMFNLKLGKSSGIFRATKIIRFAEKARMEMQVGGFMESRIGVTANYHLALSSGNIKYFDFDTPLMFTNDPVNGGIQYKKGGSITLDNTPGLGAWIDKKLLNKLESVVI